MSSLPTRWELLKQVPARRPGFVLLLILAVSLGAGLLLPRLRIDSSMETIFLDDDPEREVYEQFKRTFGEDEVIVIALKAPASVFTLATLQKIDRLTRQIEALPDDLGVDRVVSLTNVDDVRGNQGGFETGPFMRGLPHDPEALRQLERRALDNPLYRRNLLSEDARATAINVFLDYRPGDRLYKERLVLKLRELVEPERAPEEIHFAGIPVLTFFTSGYLRRDMLIFIPLTVLVMALTLWVTFRSIWGVLLPLLTVGVAVLWTLGFIALLGESISILSSVIPSLLLTLGCAYTIHVFSHYTSLTGTPEERLHHTARHVVGPVLLSGLTTVFGFASLITNNVTQVREFGLYSGFGILAAMVLAALGVPAALHYLRPRTSGALDDAGGGRVGRGLDRLVTFDLAHPRAIVVAALGALALTAVGALKLTVDTDYAANFKAGSEPVRGLLFMRENLSGERPVNVVLRASDSEEGAALEPAVLATIDGVERAMKEHPLIKTTLSVNGYLKNINEAMHEDDRAFRALPASRRLASQYVDLYGRPNEMRRFVSSDRREVVVVGRSSIISSHEFLEVMAKLKRDTAALAGRAVEVTITGSMYLLSKASIEISLGQAKSLALASLSILLALAVLYRVRSLKFGLIAFIPNFVPILLLFGVMGFAGVALTTGTSIIAGMALGIVDDDTIHFLSRYKEVRRTLAAPEAVREVMQGVGRPVVFTALTNALGFAVLTFSSFAPLVALGWLTALTMFTALIGDLMLLPAMLVLFDREPPTGS